MDRLAARPVLSGRRDSFADDGTQFDVAVSLSSLPHALAGSFSSRYRVPANLPRITVQCCSTSRHACRVLNLAAYKRWADPYAEAS